MEKTAVDVKTPLILLGASIIFGLLIYSLLGFPLRMFGFTGLYGAAIEPSGHIERLRTLPIVFIGISLIWLVFAAYNRLRAGSRRR